MSIVSSPDLLSFPLGTKSWLWPKTLTSLVVLLYLSYFSFKTYSVGTQKNRLNETAILSSHNIC